MNRTPTILDEVDQFYTQHLACTEAQRTAMVLYAAATHGMPAFVTFGRLLFVSQLEESAKTLAMEMTARLSCNAEDVAGTSYALQSALAAATNTPEQAPPTLYYDEISDVFGRSGLGGTRNPIAEVLKKGYKKGATKRWSVNRAPQTYSIFTPFLMTGLQVAVPRDIRSRCIVIAMEQGMPPEYYDVREGESWAQALNASLGAAVRTVIPDMKEFRARDMKIRGLYGRKAEVWEPLFAVALHVGGQYWLNRCAAAFTELAANGSAALVLSPAQQIVRDAAMLLDGALKREADIGFIPGRFLAAELSRLDSPLYGNRTPDGMLKLLANVMVPMGIRTHQPQNLRRRGYPDDKMRGYYASEIREAWEQIRPDEPADVGLPEFDDPFDVSGVPEDQFEYLPGDEPQPAVKPAARTRAVSGAPGRRPKVAQVERRFLLSEEIGLKAAQTARRPSR